MTVTPCRCIASSTAPVSNLPTRLIVEPYRTVLLRLQESPYMWNSGSTARVTSSGTAPKVSDATVAAMYSWKWLSSAPLGRPVVPLV